MRQRFFVGRTVCGLVAGAAATAVALSAPVSAAPPRGNALRDDSSDLSTRETRAVMHAYAQCVVKRQPARAAQVIVGNVDNGTIFRKHKQLIIGDCLRSKPSEVLSARFGGDLYRYALADALVRRDLANFDPRGFSAAARLDHRDPGAAPTPIGPDGRKWSARKYQEALDGHRKATGFAYLSRYGECVVRNAPAASKDLLLTTPDSSEEATRFKALSLALATCVPAGDTMRFGKVALRGTIAVNFYRLAKAAPAAATGTAG